MSKEGQESKRVKFGDLDTFLKIAPILGLTLLAYLQTLFPSKDEFKEIQNQLIQMDKKITEMTVLQQAITGNTTDLRRVTERIRLLELEVAKHNAQASRTTAARDKKNNNISRN
jgi:septal ring factor EnvC (AmiA/AmiB activator)